MTVQWRFLTVLQVKVGLISTSHLKDGTLDGLLDRKITKEETFFHRDALLTNHDRDGFIAFSWDHSIAGSEDHLVYVQGEHWYDLTQGKVRLDDAGLSGLLIDRRAASFEYYAIRSRK